MSAFGSVQSRIIAAKKTVTQKTVPAKAAKKRASAKKTAVKKSEAKKTVPAAAQSVTETGGQLVS
jgi:hypothetical protein